MNRCPTAPSQWLVGSRTSGKRASGPRLSTGKTSTLATTVPISPKPLVGLLRIPTRADWSRLTVFVHGFCGNLSENGLFDRIAGNLSAAGCPVLQYDWRGIGASQGSFQNSTVDQHCEDLLRLLKYVKQHFPRRELRFNAIGFSLGAALVGRVARKVSFDRIAYLSPAVHPRISMWPRYDSPEIRDALDQFGFFEKESTGIRVGRVLLDSLREFEFGEAAFRYPVPTLVCYGSNDQRIDPNLTRDVVRRCKSLNKHLIENRVEGASHSFKPTEEHWKQLAETITTWMTDRPARLPQ